MIGATEMNRRFSYHAPKPENVDTFVDIRNHGHDFAQFIDQNVPDGREKSLAVTAIEEAVMWANAGLARNQGED